MRHVLPLQLLFGAAQGKLRLEEGPQVMRLLQLNLLLPSLGQLSGGFISIGEEHAVIIGSLHQIAFDLDFGCTT